MYHGTNKKTNEGQWSHSWIFTDIMNTTYRQAPLVNWHFVLISLADRFSNLEKEIIYSFPNATSQNNVEMSYWCWLDKTWHGVWSNWEEEGKRRPYFKKKRFNFPINLFSVHIAPSQYRFHAKIRIRCSIFPSTTKKVSPYIPYSSRLGKKSSNFLLQFERFLLHYCSFQLSDADCDCPTDYGTAWNQH